VFTDRLFGLVTDDRPRFALAPWTDFTLSPWTYRPGHGLEWHSDRGYLAGYIYYAHPDWHSSWGGELLVAPDAAATSIPESVCEAGGVFIYPRPNRLVLLRGGVLHCIKKVEGAAGKAFRASISGFFLDAGVRD
jgi:Rps23 Pro-64 3,4-dihydroxylase Tpa1-like proline 4-hydroxylase